MREFYKNGLHSSSTNSSTQSSNNSSRALKSLSSLQDETQKSSCAIINNRRSSWRSKRSLRHSSKTGSQVAKYAAFNELTSYAVTISTEGPETNTSTTAASTTTALTTAEAPEGVAKRGAIELTAHSTESRRKRAAGIAAANAEHKADEEEGGLQAVLSESGRELVQLLMSVGVWYTSSLVLTASNKYLFDILAFPLPLFVTFLHFSFASLALRLCFFCFPTTLPPLRKLTASYVSYTLLPIAVCAAADVSLTNVAFRFISVAAITLVKSSSVFFTYLLAVCWGMELFRLRIVAILIFIILSISLTLPEMEIKSFTGVAITFGAVLVGAVRWILIHRTLKRDRHLSILQLLLLTHPLSTIALSPVVVFYELPTVIRQAFKNGAVIIGSIAYDRFITAVSIVFGCVFMAAMVVLSELQVVGLTSSVSLCVAGLGKEILTISMSAVIFGELLTYRVILGIVASIVGISYYSYIRYKLLLDENTAL